MSKDNYDNRPGVYSWELGNFFMYSEGDVNPDYSKMNNLAKLYYDFLMGKSNKLPKFKVVDAVAKKSKVGSRGVISYGYGIQVVFDENQIYIDFEEPMDKKKYIFERITKDGHKSLKSASKKGQDSVFDKARIIVFINYLKQYHKQHINDINIVKKGKVK